MENWKAPREIPKFLVVHQTNIDRCRLGKGTHVKGEGFKVFTLFPLPFPRPVKKTLADYYILNEICAKDFRVSLRCVNVKQVALQHFQRLQQLNITLLC